MHLKTLERNKLQDCPSLVKCMDPLSLPSVNHVISQIAITLVINDTLRCIFEGRWVKVNELGGTGTAHSTN
jgi:hypothetical protein